MGSIFWGGNFENFSINVYTQIYIVRICISGFIRDPLPLYFIQEVWSLLIVIQGGKTAIISSHLLNVVFSIAARLGIFKPR